MCDEVKSCFSCKNAVPCKTESKSIDMVICEKFQDIAHESDPIESLEELQAINASIPDDDEFLPDYSGIEEEQPISIEVGGVKMEVKQ